MLLRQTSDLIWGPGFLPGGLSGRTSVAASLPGTLVLLGTCCWWSRAGPRPGARGVSPGPSLAFLISQTPPFSPSAQVLSVKGVLGIVGFGELRDVAGPLGPSDLGALAGMSQARVRWEAVPLLSLKTLHLGNQMWVGDAARCRVQVWAEPPPPPGWTPHRRLAGPRSHFCFSFLATGGSVVLIWCRAQ